MWPLPPNIPQPFLLHSLRFLPLPFILIPLPSCCKYTALCLQERRRRRFVFPFYWAGQLWWAGDSCLSNTVVWDTPIALKIQPFNLLHGCFISCSFTHSLVGRAWQCFIRLSLGISCGWMRPQWLSDEEETEQRGRGGGGCSGGAEANVQSQMRVVM